jgi:EAL domain-containing protein (putative c-di-GMP-specific phosphodiesterase class I)
LLGEGGIRAVLQPVYDVYGSVPGPCGVECLSRGPRQSNAESAAVLFDYVRRKKREADVDRACISAALEAAALLHSNVRVGLNVHASTLARDEGFTDWLLERLGQRGISPARLVLEIVEHGPAQDLEALADCLTALRRHGVRLALDDVGTGTSGLRLIVEWAPEFIKIDRFFVFDATRCARKRAIIKSIVRLAEDLGAVTVAEGVETTEQLELVIESGVRLVQGYVLCKALPVDELQARVPQLFPGRT